MRWNISHTESLMSLWKYTFIVKNLMNDLKITNPCKALVMAGSTERSQLFYSPQYWVSILEVLNDPNKFTILSTG